MIIRTFIKKERKIQMANVLPHLPNQMEFVVISLVTYINLDNIKKELKENSTAQALIQNILQN